MRVKNRSIEEKAADFNPFNHLLVSKFESSLKQEFVNKFLDGIDFYNECPSSDLKVVDSMEYDFVKNRFPETICNVRERVEMVQT